MSVIIPAFNAERTLRETLTSVHGQTHRHIEVFIVDDGSTDKTAEIARSFCKADRRFHLLSCDRNSGVARARNQGLEVASGDWIALLDADDLWNSEHLELLLRNVASMPGRVGFVSASHRRINASSQVLFSAPPWKIEGHALRQMIYQNFVGNGSAMLVDREIALSVGGFDERLREAGVEGCEDFLFQLHICARHKVAALPTYTVGYRESLTAMSSDAERMWQSSLMALQIFQDQHADIDIPAHVLRWHFANRLLVVSHYNWKKGHWLKAIRQLGSASIWDPKMTGIGLLNRGIHWVGRQLRADVSNASHKFVAFSEFTSNQGLETGFRSSWTSRLLSKLRVRRMQSIARIDKAAVQDLTPVVALSGQTEDRAKGTTSIHASREFRNRRNEPILRLARHGRRK